MIMVTVKLPMWKVILKAITSFRRDRIETAPLCKIPLRKQLYHGHEDMSIVAPFLGSPCKGNCHGKAVTERLTIPPALRATSLYTREALNMRP